MNATISNKWKPMYNVSIVVGFFISTVMMGLFNLLFPPAGLDEGDKGNN
jgi:hypothetical protein